ncbi:MAG TPA: hypothetical protein VFF06_23615 [Polyangia bacterium]|nr:hypothetical protein [Polyangia bacterium]
MKRILAFATLLVAGCGSTGGSGNCSLVGAWKQQTVLSATFNGDGSYSAMFGSTTDTGMWSLNGSAFSTTDAACGSSPGTYTVSFSSDCATATFALVNDSCGRAGTLGHAVLTRQ